SKTHLAAASTLGLAVLVLAGPCRAQINMDARRSPAEIFADGCAACHANPSALKRTNAAFLRRHYSTGPTQAAIMATYLANLPPEQRDPAQPKPEQQGNGKSAESPANAQALAPVPEGISTPILVRRTAVAGSKSPLEPFEE